MTQFLTAADNFSIPVDMLVQIALGQEPGDVVSSRYGYSLQDWEVLKTLDWFKRDIERKREDLRASGITFKAKAQMMAEDLLADTYREAKKSESGAFKLDTLKYLAKMADLEPRMTQTVPTGSGFSINIVLPGGDTAPRQAPVIDASFSTGTPEEIVARPPVLDTLWRNADLSEGVEA
jgi:hypothetical protein